MKNSTIYIMSALRLISGFVEILAAYLIFRYNRIETALRINSLLAVMGPSLLIIGIFTGITGLTSRLPLYRLILIYAGALLIFWGTRT
ncbi:MAG: YqhV family protein [Firmicutes bacterium]|nr:YqhV family protein [Bacillota bacterium]